MQPEYIEALITEGFFSYTDLTFLEAEQLSEIIGIDPEAADEIIIFAEDEAERIEREGEPEEMQDQPVEVATEGAVSEEAAAVAEGEVPAEAITNEPATPAGGFESLFQPEGEAQAAGEAQPSEEPHAEGAEQAPPAGEGENSAPAEETPRVEADGEQKVE
jgi:transcription termination/antitermination protein NusA